MAYEHPVNFINDVSLNGQAVLNFYPEKMTKAERDALSGTALYNFRLVSVTDLDAICYYSTTKGKWITLGTCDALKSKGTIGTSTSTVTSKIFPEDAEVGDFYIVAEDGEYTSKDGVTKKQARKGDMLFCTALADATTSKSPVFEIFEGGNGKLSAELTKAKDTIEYNVTNTLKSANVHCSIYQLGGTKDILVMSDIELTADVITVYIGSSIAVGTQFRLDVIYG